MYLLHLHTKLRDGEQEAKIIPYHGCRGEEKTDERDFVEAPNNMKTSLHLIRAEYDKYGVLIKIIFVSQFHISFLVILYQDKLVIQ